MQGNQSAGPSSHEANYNLIAAALATATATMLTLLTTLGTTSVTGNPTLKLLLEAQLLVIEVALILSVVSLLSPRRRDQEAARARVRGPRGARDPPALGERVVNHILPLRAESP